MLGSRYLRRNEKKRERGKRQDKEGLEYRTFRQNGEIETGRRQMPVEDEILNLLGRKYNIPLKRGQVKVPRELSSLKFLK